MQKSVGIHDSIDLCWISFVDFWSFFIVVIIGVVSFLAFWDLVSQLGWQVLYRLCKLLLKERIEGGIQVVSVTIGSIL